MGSKRSRQYQVQDDFSKVIWKAYKRGTTDNAITVNKLIEEIKSDLIKMKVN